MIIDPTYWIRVLTNTRRPRFLSDAECKARNFDALQARLFATIKRCPISESNLAGAK
jgi:hypothetical protein